MPRTALVVLVPEADDAVRELRAAYDWSASVGVPAHVTLLFPFAPSDAVDEDAVAQVVVEHDGFDFALTEVRRFGDDVTYLAPEPDGPFRVLTQAFATRWPEYPPYDGEHDEPIPHLTVAERNIDPELDLPIAARATEVTLLEEGADGRWTTRASFALRSAG